MSRAIVRWVSGPVLHARIEGPFALREAVRVGAQGLAGEVVRLDGDQIVVQVYEDTTGLRPGVVVQGDGSPLSIRLGPGLLGHIFDGLLRPLAGQASHFVGAGMRRAEPRRFQVTPTVQPGDALRAGQPFAELIGSGARAQAALVPPFAQGEVVQLEPAGEYAEDAVIATLRDADGRTQALTMGHDWPVRVPRPARARLTSATPLVTGQRILDSLFPVALGGKAAIPGGFGTGKTVLEQAVAKFADVDVVVYVGCGERGNEMAELLEEFVTLKDPWRGGALMERTIVVANTSNMPVAAREASIYTAVTMAEYYREQGLDVLLLADSISRWAEALREISSSLEEMPGEEGYPTYLGSRLAAFFERAGVVETCAGGQGSLSMILAVSPPGGDLTEPVTQACLRSAGAFLMLDADLAHRRHFPAINWDLSYSLYEGETSGFFNRLAPDWQELKVRAREILRAEEALREVAEMVGAEGLQDNDRLLLLAARRLRQEFLCQNSYTDDAFSPPEETAARLRSLLDWYGRARDALAAGEMLEQVLGEEP
jgi:V/A-type H+-transporting ATPase subunit A